MQRISWQAVRDAKRAGHAYVIVDGTLIPIGRVARDRPFCSGKRKKHGMNLQVIASPDGDILWVSGALPGSVHDKKAGWIWGVLDELEDVGLVAFADKGYQGITWAKVPNTRSSRHGGSPASCAAARGAPGNSPRPFTYCSSARRNQVGNSSLSFNLTSKPRDVFAVSLETPPTASNLKGKEPLELVGTGRKSR